MKTMKIKTLTLQALAALALASAAAAADYKGLAMDLAQTAKMNGIRRVALGSFSAAAGIENEARFAEEKTSGGLSSQKDLEVLDQAALTAYAGPGWLDKIPSKIRPQAFIKGSVFQQGEDITLLVKLVDARSGRVLGSMELKSKAHFSELPAVPYVNWGAPVALGPMQEDFRDAPADDGFDCAGAFKEMTRLNTAAVDLKARYWALKMKEPGFTLGSLSRNPGSEIRDFQVKHQFYELLAKYHEQDFAPALPEAQSKKLEAFMEKEDTVLDRCGIK